VHRDRREHLLAQSWVEADHAAQRRRDDHERGPFAEQTQQRRLHPRQQQPWHQLDRLAWLAPIKGGELQQQIIDLARAELDPIELRRPRGGLLARRGEGRSDRLVDRPQLGRKPTYEPADRGDLQRKLELLTQLDAGADLVLNDQHATLVGDPAHLEPLFALAWQGGRLEPTQRRRGQRQALALRRSRVAVVAAPEQLRRHEPARPRERSIHRAVAQPGVLPRDPQGQRVEQSLALARCLPAGEPGREPAQRLLLTQRPCPFSQLGRDEQGGARRALERR
jgi:hypothetical protein